MRDVRGGTLTEDERALAAEFNDDPSPASQTLVDLVLDSHARLRAALEATGVRARFRRELKIKTYLLDGWREYVRHLDTPFTSRAWPRPGDRVRALVAEFGRRADPLLFNNVVLAYRVAHGDEIGGSVRTEAERMWEELAAFAEGRLDRDALVSRFGRFSLRPYELSEPRFYELDDATLRAIASLSRPRPGPPKRELAEALAGRTPATADTLVAVRELARARMLDVVDALRVALHEAAAAAGVADPFALPIEELLARPSVGPQ